MVTITRHERCPPSVTFVSNHPGSLPKAKEKKKKRTYHRAVHDEEVSVGGEFKPLRVYYTTLLEYIK